MPSAKPQAAKGGARGTRGMTQATNAARARTGLWHRALQPKPRVKPSQAFSICPPGTFLGLSEEMRRQQEVLFQTPVNTPISGSWKNAEDYWYRKDIEMIQYIQDFPLKKWLLNEGEAREAYEAMQKRFRMRDEGKSVYADGIPGLDLSDIVIPDLTLADNNDQVNSADTAAEDSGIITRQTRKTVTTKSAATITATLEADKVLPKRQPRKTAAKASNLPDLTQHDKAEIVSGQEVTSTRPMRQCKKLHLDSGKDVNKSSPSEKDKPKRSARNIQAPIIAKPNELHSIDDGTKPKFKRALRVSEMLSPPDEPTTAIQSTERTSIPLYPSSSTEPSVSANPSVAGDTKSFFVEEYDPSMRKRKRKSTASEDPLNGFRGQQPLFAVYNTESLSDSGHYLETTPINHNTRESPPMQREVVIGEYNNKGLMPLPPFARQPNTPQMVPHFPFPWQNDWATEDPEAWDDSIYEPSRLEHIAQIHAKNKRIVTKYMENGKHGAQHRKNAAIEEGVRSSQGEEVSTTTGAQAGAVKPPKKRLKTKTRRNEDQREHFSGRVDFADEHQAAAFQRLGYATIEDGIKAAMCNPFDDALKRIEVAYDPGDSLLDNLHLPRISLMDIARTRLQIASKRILCDRAAECLIDFCPDLLSGYTLLQVVSETKYGNTAVQIRLGQNGSMLSDSTITKRVSAALNRDHDKSEAAELARQFPNFKKANRENYSKYKAFRALRRTTGFSKISRFMLVSAFRNANGTDGAARDIPGTRITLPPLSESLYGPSNTSGATKPVDSGVQSVAGDILSDSDSAGAAQGRRSSYGARSSLSLDDNTLPPLSNPFFPLPPVRSVQTTLDGWAGRQRR